MQLKGSVNTVEALFEINNFIIRVNANTHTHTV
jgi:hypothetical protein